MVILERGTLEAHHWQFWKFFLRFGLRLLAIDTLELLGQSAQTVWEPPEYLALLVPQPQLALE